MKRDNDLIREVLLEVEASGPGSLSFSNEEDGREKVYQLLLLGDASYIKGNANSDGFVVVRMTWQGHEFLDAIRSDTVWNKTKERISSTGGSASLEVIKTVAEGITKALIFPAG